MPAEPKLTQSTDEVRPSGLFGSRNIFEIPYFQRPYKWDSKKVNQLQADLLKIVDGQVDVHFLGAIITHERPKANATDSNRFEVVDGQQRMTTIYLFICAAVAALIEAGELAEAAEHYRNFMIDPINSSAGSNLRLQPSAEDRVRLNVIVDDIVSSAGFKDLPIVTVSAFRKLPVISQPPAGAGKAIKNNYANARRFFKDQFKQGQIGRVRDILNALLGRLTVVQIQIPDPTIGPKIFDSLNSKQEPMTTGDLIRNDIFSKATASGGDHVDEIDRDHWQPFYKRFWVENKNYFDDYFFPFGLVDNPQVAKSQMYGQLIARWKDLKPEDVIRDLEKYQSHFMDLATGSNTAHHPVALADSIRRLHDAGAPSSVYPFIMRVSREAGDSISAATATEIVDLVDSFLTRRAICGFEPTGLHAVFKGLWKDLNGDVTKERVIEEIAKHKTVMRPSDDVLRGAIRDRDLYLVGVTPYVVREYDRSLGGDQHSTVAQLEHVLPQNPARGTWLQFTQSERESLHHKLANLLPLSATMNPALSNSPYDQKRPVYISDSVFKSTRDFGAEYDDWTPDLLKQRTEMLADWAVSRWPALEADTE